jgi:DeoR family transcriptional regulator, suf operon transcriptional repressor
VRTFVNSFVDEFIYPTNLLAMEAMETGLVGYRGMQADVLLVLKKRQPLTAGELATQFGVTPNAMRRHLETLEAGGVVSHSREVRGVGGPVHAFQLTESGEALFPRSYGNILLETLDAMAVEHGRASVPEFFRRKWTAMADAAGPALSQSPLAERVQLVAELWSSLGYMAEADVDRDTGMPVLRKHNCAIRAVAEHYPEICATEAEFIDSVLGEPCTRREHILAGCNRCEYVVGARSEEPRDPDQAPSDAENRRGEA